jgi:hypothetical protein
MNVEGIIAGDINAWAEVAGMADAQAHRPHCPTCGCNGPLCDYCDQCVMVTLNYAGDPVWVHRNGLFSCDLVSNNYAQVNGSDRP